MRKAGLREVNSFLVNLLKITQQDDELSWDLNSGGLTPKLVLRNVIT